MVAINKIKQNKTESQIQNWNWNKNHHHIYKYGDRCQTFIIFYNDTLWFFSIFFSLNLSISRYMVAEQQQQQQKNLSFSWRPNKRIYTKQTQHVSFLNDSSTIHSFISIQFIYFTYNNNLQLSISWGRCSSSSSSLL